MKNRLKYPLSILVVWHPSFAQGREIADKLYSTFCRDIGEPLSRGLGIPVYYRSVSPDIAPIPIHTTHADRTAIVLLIDQNYMIDEAFRRYTESIGGLVDNNTRIYPVALCKQSYGIGSGLDKLQFIRAYQGDLSIPKNMQFSLKTIKSEMLHDCARLMMNMQAIWTDDRMPKIPSPVKLFLSHAKKDGLNIAQKFKAFIEKETKLDVFFDTVDVADSYDFEKQFEEQIKNSALVVFHTDEYSTREWCRIEVLIAKRNKCSIVVVHDIKNGEKRAFPYLGNTPTIVMQIDEEGSFYDIVNLTLYQVLNNLFQLELLETIQNGYKQDGAEFISITSPPELFNYVDILKKKVETGKRLIILYPEPPLGAEELRILNDIDAEIKFITPISLPTL